jgi:hypothetical protein
LSVVHLQTDPEGKFVDDVGIFLIDKLLTNVAHDLSAVMFDPIINAEFLDTILLEVPPNIAE